MESIANVINALEHIDMLKRCIHFSSNTTSAGKTAKTIF